MTDLDSLLRAVLADPDDDAPRLAFSDLLEEAGQPERAEFVRVQCELASFPPCPRSHFPGEYQGGMCLACQGKTAPLRRRELELLSAHAREWDPCYPWGDVSYLTRCPFRRGFRESLECAWGDWSAHAAAILASQPVREVTLLTWPRLILSGEPGASLYRLPESPTVIAVPLTAGAEEHGAVTLRLLAAHWPNVRFALPPEASARARAQFEAECEMIEAGYPPEAARRIADDWANPPT